MLNPQEISKYLAAHREQVEELHKTFGKTSPMSTAEEPTAANPINGKSEVIRSGKRDTATLLAQLPPVYPR